MFGFDPITIGVATALWLSFRKQSGTDFGKMTAVREEIYQNAMQKADGERLKQLADEFEKEGLKVQAWMMRKRADWKLRSPEQKKIHDEIFNKALSSVKIDRILAVAQVFEDLTATIKAGQLRERVKSLQMKAQAETTEKVVVETTAEVSKTANGVSNHATDPVSEDAKPAIAE